MKNASQYPDMDMRQYERRPFMKEINYSINADEDRTLTLRGKAIDISESGMGIETDYPLAPGHTLWVNGTIDRVGTVRWCVQTDSLFRAGIKLKDYVRYFDSDVVYSDLPVSEETTVYSPLLDKATDQFNRQLMEIEKKCLQQTETSQSLMQATEQACSDVLDVCEKFEQGINHNKESLKLTQTWFREKTDRMLSKSHLISRARTWPQGSQGDYKTLEYAYKNAPLSEGIGYYLDLYLLRQPLGDGVRNRIKNLENILRDEIAKREQPALLNIACGSCRELMGIAPEIIESQARIICIDNDNDALSFAQSRLAHVGVTDQVEFRKYNAVRMFDDELNMREFGKQDIIYSVGLFDYLPTDFLIRLLKALYTLLNPGGMLIAAFKDADRYRHQVFHWIVDWDGFQQRTEGDFRKILADANIPDSAIAETREESGIIIFYFIRKK